MSWFLGSSSFLGGGVSGIQLPSEGLLALEKSISGEAIDTVGTSDRENQLRQYGTFLNGETLTSASIVGTETVISSEGTCTPVVSAGTITFDAGTCWDIVLSNGSTYSHPTKTGAAAGIWFDRSGAGIHLTVNVADIDAHVTEAIDQGSNTLELQGWTEGETDGVEAVTDSTFQTGTDWTLTSGSIISNGNLTITLVDTEIQYVYQSYDIPANTQVRIIVVVDSISVGGIFSLSYGTGFNFPVAVDNITTAGTHIFDIEYTSTIVNVGIKRATGTASGSSIVISGFSIQWLPQGKIPLLSDLSASCLNQTPTYTGRAKYSLSPKNAPCATFDGTAGDYISIAGLTGSETVISSGGTSTPSISAGKIDFTAGTCWNLQLSNGMVFPLSESEGTTVYGYDSEGNNYTGTITASDIGAFWGTTQDSFFHDWEYGRTEDIGYGPELVVNGGLDTSDSWDTSGAVTFVDGRVFANNVTTTAFLYQLFVVTAGITYVIEADVELISGECFGRVASAQGTPSVTESGRLRQVITAFSGSAIGLGGTNFVGYVDNISVKKFSPGKIPANPYTGLSCLGQPLTTQLHQLTANDWSLPATGELRDADDIILADTASRFIYDTDGATPLDWSVDDITGGFINDQLFYGKNKISLYDDAQIDPALTKIKKYHGVS